MRWSFGWKGISRGPWSLLRLSISTWGRDLDLFRGKKETDRQRQVRPRTKSHAKAEEWTRVSFSISLPWGMTILFSLGLSFGGSFSALTTKLCLLTGGGASAVVTLSGSTGAGATRVM